MLTPNQAIRIMLSAMALATLVLFIKLAPARETEAPRQNAEVRVYEVFGMGCPACQGGLSKLVKKVDGVSEAEVNWKEQWLKVTFTSDATADDEKIFEAIRKANFTPGKRLPGDKDEGNG